MSYQTRDQSATSTITVLNPTPVISQVSPATIVQISTLVIVTGSGFISSSQITVGGSPVSTAFLDASHLSATLLVPGNQTTALSLAVSNPDPGAVTTAPIALRVAIAPVTIVPQSGAVRLGSTLALSGMQLGASLSGGIWSVNGGSVNGSITATGIYSPPPSIPPSTVSVTYQALGQTATSTLTVLNPVPAITQVSPAKLTQLSTPVVVAGTGFISGSQISADGTSVATTFIDSGHLSATLLVSTIDVKSVTLAVLNPNPAAVESNQADVPVAIAPLTISPSSVSVRLGSTTVFNGLQECTTVNGGTWAVAGGPANGTIGTNGVYSPPSVVPGSNVTISYPALGQTAYSTVTLLNPAPTINQVSPSSLSQLNTTVSIAGNGFLPESQILVNGATVGTVFVDSHHLSGAVTVPNLAVTSLAVTVSNPNPGAVISNAITLLVAIAPLLIMPQGASVHIGNTLTLVAEQ